MVRLNTWSSFRVNLSDFIANITSNVMYLLTLYIHVSISEVIIHP